ncbi:hypothetical protein [Pseudoalteromonas nigrifaciens]|uniref:hypothetical protein n=1 Tax=Pseudoalteromonas nigrifaciens TaxID=28109 RepID=UPI003FD06E6A
MKKLLALFLAMQSSYVFSAAPWGLCPGTPVTGQVPCDTSCFGPAGTNLGSTYTQAETELQNAISENTNSWVSANDTFIDYLGDYYDQAYQSNADRVTALDGTSKTITLSLDLISQTYSRSIDHFVESYRVIQSDLRIAKQVHENAKAYMSNHTSPTGDYLLSNIEDYANNRELQKKLDIVNTLQRDKGNHLNSNQQSLLLGQVNNAVDGELTIYNFDDFIVSGEINEEQLKLVMTSVYALYLEDSKNPNELVSRSNNVKKEIALDALIKTLRYISETNELQSLENDIYNQNFTSYVSGANKANFKHALKQEHVYQKAIENNLLNSYFKQAKANNALKIITDR